MIVTFLLLPFVIVIGSAIALGTFSVLFGTIEYMFPSAKVAVTTYPRLNIVQGHPVGLDTCVYCNTVCQFDPTVGFFNCWNCGCYNPISGAAEWPMSTREWTPEEEARGRRWKRRFKVTGIVIVLLILAFIALFIYAATLPNTWSA